MERERGFGIYCLRNLRHSQQTLDRWLSYLYQTPQLFLDVPKISVPSEVAVTAAFSCFVRIVVVIALLLLNPGSIIKTY